MVTMCLIIPTLVPWYYWNETVWNAYFVCVCLRYIFLLHCTWLINSAAHMWGNRPYDKHINPAENLLVSWGIMGEGFHNYHHTFPNDYSASEFGWNINLTTMFIDLMAYIGQVYDRKGPSIEIVRKRQLRTGDGSHTFRMIGCKQSCVENPDKQKVC